MRTSSSRLSLGPSATDERRTAATSAFGALLAAGLPDRDGCLVREQAEHPDVAVVERRGAFLVEQLEHSDHRALVEERDTEDVLWHVADALADLGRPALVLLYVRDGHRLPADRHATRDAMSERDLDLLQRVRAFAEGDLEPQLVLRLVDEEERGGPGRDHAGGRLDDPLEEVGVARRGGDRPRKCGFRECVSQAGSELLVLQAAVVLRGHRRVG